MSKREKFKKAAETARMAKIIKDLFDPENPPTGSQVEKAMDYIWRNEPGYKESAAASKKISKALENAKTSADIDIIFNVIKSSDTEHVKDAVIRLREESSVFVMGARFNPDAAMSESVLGPAYSSASPSEKMELLHAQLRIIDHIVQIEGANVSGMLSRAQEETKNLSPAEFHSFDGVQRALAKAHDDYMRLDFIKGGRRSQPPKP